MYFSTDVFGLNGALINRLLAFVLIAVIGPFGAEAALQLEFEYLGKALQKELVGLPKLDHLNS